MLEIKNKHGIIRLKEWGRCVCFLERERRKPHTPRKYKETSTLLVGTRRGIYTKNTR